MPRLEVSNYEYKVKGYYYKWSVIDVLGDYALLENCTWGDETCYLVVKRDAPIKRKFSYDILLSGVMEGSYDEIQEVIAETYDDLQTALEDEGIL